MRTEIKVPTITDCESRPYEIAAYVYVNRSIFGCELCEREEFMQSRILLYNSAYGSEQL